MIGHFRKLLPVCAAAALALLAASIQPANAQVVALGDSNISGPGISSSETYPAQLQAALNARGKKVSVANAGVFGNTTADVLARMDADVPQGTKLVVLWVGINDPRRGIQASTTASNIAAINGKLKARGIAVYRVPAGVSISVRKPGFLISDNLHLNGAGQAKIVQATLPAIERMLR